MGSPKQILCLLFVLFLSTQIDGNRLKRMFALCPPHFIRIGNECYFISQNRVNWLDAHFECKDRNSRLAEPFRQDDRFLRKYLNYLPASRPDDIWIGARFNWERNKWQWGHNGKDLTYQSFSQMSADNKDLKFHCAIMKPNLKYRWSASSCEQQHQYICQHRMPYVNEKNRQKVYSKWNETYPNEMANEIEVVVSEDDLLRRRRKMQRSHMKAHTNNRQQIKDEPNNHQRNDIHYNRFLQPDQMQNPNRKIRMGGNRTRNHWPNRRFELNRIRGNGVRQRIHFDNFNNTRDGPFNRNHRRMWHQRQKFNGRETTIHPTVWPNTSPPETPIFISTPKTTTTTTTTTTTPTTTTTTTTTTPVPPILTSNDVTHDDDDQYQRQRQLEEDERRQYEEHRIQAERELEAERRKAFDLEESERQRQEMIKQQEREMERIKNERKRQDLEREQEIEQNKQLHQAEQDRRTELIRQRDEQSRNNQHAIQTNEILDVNTPTTLSPSEKKKLKLKRLRDRLNKLSPEEQNLFFQLRAERNKKRGTDHLVQL